MLLVTLRAEGAGGSLRGRREGAIASSKERDGGGRRGGGEKLRQAECNNLEKLPAAHATQAVLPPRGELGTAPCGQEAQALAAEAGMKEPAEHGRHCPTPVTDALGLKVPATQGRQSVEPSGAISWPRGPTNPSRQMHAFALQVRTVARAGARGGWGGGSGESG